MHDFLVHLINCYDENCHRPALLLMNYSLANTTQWGNHLFNLFRTKYNALHNFIQRFPLYIRVPSAIKEKYSHVRCIVEKKLIGVVFFILIMKLTLSKVRSNGFADRYWLTYLVASHLAITRLTTITEYLLAPEISFRYPLRFCGALVQRCVSPTGSCTLRGTRLNSQIPRAIEILKPLGIPPSCYRYSSDAAYRARF